MKFTIALLALPALALAVPASNPITHTPTPTPTGAPDLSICEEQAGSYAEYCPRCEPNCADREGKDYELCLYSVFSTINGIQSQCWQHGGIDCKNRAVDEVCGTQ